MQFLRPLTLGDALAARKAQPEAVPVAGGTDVMVGLNAGGHHPAALLDLSRVPELAAWRHEPAEGATASRGTSSWVRVGAGLTYGRVAAELADQLPGLAEVARVMGSPQIRNRATIGGNLVTAAPAGDGYPPLLAAGAFVEAVSVRGMRRMPIREFLCGLGRPQLAPDELVSAVLVPPAAGPERFLRVGGRWAVAVAWCSFALTLRPDEQWVGTGIGAAAPTPVPARAAEEYLAEHLPWHTRAPLTESVVARFGELVATETAPVDDLRCSGAYRRHAVAVLGARGLREAWEEYRCR